MEAIVAVLLLEINAENNESVDRRSFGNTTIQGQPVGVQPQQMPQRSNNNSSFGGSRQGTTSQPLILVVALAATMVLNARSLLGQKAVVLKRNRLIADSIITIASRGSFGNSAPRPSMQPNQTIERPTQNSGSFGGHR